jgi:hypothetical protein
MGAPDRTAATPPMSITDKKPLKPLAQLHVTPADATPDPSLAASSSSGGAASTPPMSITDKHPLKPLAQLHVQPSDATPDPAQTTAAAPAKAAQSVQSSIDSVLATASARWREYSERGTPLRHGIAVARENVNAVLGLVKAKEVSYEGTIAYIYICCAC